MISSRAKLGVRLADNLYGEITAANLSDQRQFDPDHQPSFLSRELIAARESSAKLKLFLTPSGSAEPAPLLSIC